MSDDLQLFMERLPSILAWLYATPWWVPAVCAFALTGFLILLSWPKPAIPSSSWGYPTRAQQGAAALPPPPLTPPVVTAPSQPPLRLSRYDQERFLRYLDSAYEELNRAIGEVVSDGLKICELQFLPPFSGALIRHSTLHDVGAIVEMVQVYRQKMLALPGEIIRITSKPDHWPPIRPLFQHYLDQLNHDIAANEFLGKLAGLRTLLGERKLDHSSLILLSSLGAFCESVREFQKWGARQSDEILKMRKRYAEALIT